MTAKNPLDKKSKSAMEWFVPIDKADESEIVQMTVDEFFALTHKLEGKHSIFYKLFEIGKPIFTRKLPTAAVNFDRKEAEWVNFLFNPDFWKWLDGDEDYSRLFIICHEMLHIILRHGLRTKDCKNREMANFCLDLVVNHLLIKKFGFSRDKVKGSDSLVWKDTLFDNNPNYSGPKVELGRTFEYYYNLAKKYFPKIEGGGREKGKGGKGEGQSGKGMPQLADNHDGLSPEECDELIEELNDLLGDNEKNDLKDMINEHCQNDENAPDGEPGEGKPGPAGKGTGNIWKFVDVDAKKIKKKKKWETVIQKWARMKMKQEFRDIEQWARINRRLTEVAHTGLMLPSEMEVDDQFMDEDQVEVWFFQDTSGSCSGFRKRFFTAAASLVSSPPKLNDRFKVRMFCFDTEVYETTLESGKLYGFGGTEFQPIENKIQSIMKQEKIQYPAACFIVTDGMGSYVKPEKPANWYWFLSNNYKNYIPKESHVFMLKDYE